MPALYNPYMNIMRMRMRERERKVSEKKKERERENKRDRLCLRAGGGDVRLYVYK